MKRTDKQWKVLVSDLKNRIVYLEGVLKLREEQGVALTDYQEKDILKIRKKYPKETSKLSDSCIACAYTEYCERYHGAGWTDIDINDFYNQCL